MILLPRHQMCSARLSVLKLGMTPSQPLWLPNTWMQRSKQGKPNNELICAAQRKRCQDLFSNLSGFVCNAMGKARENVDIDRLQLMGPWGVNIRVTLTLFFVKLSGFFLNGQDLVIHACSHGYKNLSGETSLGHGKIFQQTRVIPCCAQILKVNFPVFCLGWLVARPLAHSSSRMTCCATQP